MPALPKIPWESIGPEHRLDYKRAFMLIDLNRCTGCHSCSVSCKTEHEVPLGNFRMRVRYLERPDRPTLAFLPLLCMQCQDAPCLKACPTEAIGRLDDGRVVINDEKCCGNKACIAACPYGAISINEETSKAEKCDFCTHRTEIGLAPACVASCPTDAIRFGDLDDPQDPVTQEAQAKQARPFREDADTAPSVLYVDHERWMEPKSNLGVRLSPEDDDIIYEQNNLSSKII